MSSVASLLAIMLAGIGVMTASERQVLLTTNQPTTMECLAMPAAVVTHSAPGEWQAVGLNPSINNDFRFVSLDQASISSDLVRVPGAGLDAVQITLRLADSSGGLDGRLPAISTNRGSLGAISALGDGRYRTTLTPAGSGEHHISTSWAGIQQSLVPVVFEVVHEDWGQPRAIPGTYVNTPGWEDGLTITPDGEWLFVHYGPFHPSGLLYHAGDLNHPWNTTAIGPYGPPQRPDFFTTRIVNGQIQHYLALAPEFGPFYSVPTLFYGFRRQADGSYAEPFMIGIEDNDGANLGPYGMSFRQDGGNNTTMLFSFDHAWDGEDSGHDVYTTTITLGHKNIIGRFLPTVPITTDFFNATRLGFSDHSGIQGNSHLHTLSGGVVESVWTDSENGTNNLSVHTLQGSYPAGPWTSVELPAPITDGYHQFQPFFDGETLYYSSNAPLGLASIRASAWQGGAYGQSSSWATPEVILATTDNSAVVGTNWGVGEANLATIDGQLWMFFIYAQVRDVVNGEADIDFNAGMMPYLGPGGDDG